MPTTRTLLICLALLSALLGGCRLFDGDDDWEDDPCSCGYPAMVEGGQAVPQMPAGRVLPGPAR